MSIDHSSYDVPDHFRQFFEKGLFADRSAFDFKFQQHEPSWGICRQVTYGNIDHSGFLRARDYDSLLQLVIGFID